MEAQLAPLSSSAPAASLPSLLPTAAALRTYGVRYLVRGGVTMMAAGGQYTLEHVGFAAPWLTWLVLMPLMGMGLGIYGRRLQRQGTMATTPADATMRLLQKSFLLILLVAMVSACFIGWELAHPPMLALYGLTTVLAGRVLRFRPLQAGGVVCGLAGVAAAGVPAHPQLLLIAGAMLAGYVVPGYLLWSRHRA